MELAEFSHELRLGLLSSRLLTTWYQGVNDPVLSTNALLWHKDHSSACSDWSCWQVVQLTLNFFHEKKRDPTSYVDHQRAACQRISYRRGASRTLTTDVQCWLYDRRAVERDDSTVLDRGSSYIGTRNFVTEMCLQIFASQLWSSSEIRWLSNIGVFLTSSPIRLFFSRDTNRQWCQESDYWYETKSRSLISSVAYYSHYWYRHQSIRNRYSWLCSSPLEISFWYSWCSFSSIMIRFENTEKSRLFVYLTTTVSITNDTYEQK